MRLAALPPLLRDEPALTRALGEPAARLAVVEVARPISIAALADFSNRRPLVVVTPTGTMAAQLAEDLEQFLPAGDVALFPAWETLPFERVSPSVETMGRRLEVLWRLRDPDRCPAVIVTAVRALLQRLGPEATTVDPIAVHPGDVDRSRRARHPPRRASVTAARTSSSTAASSPVAGPSSTSSRPPPTPRFASICGATRSTA